MTGFTRLMSAAAAIILAVSFCAFAGAESSGTEEKASVKLPASLEKYAEFIPKEVAEWIAEDFEETEATELEKSAGLVASLVNKKDPCDPDLDIYVLKKNGLDLETFANEEAANYGSVAYKFVSPYDGKDCYGYSALEYFDEPYFTGTMITDNGNGFVTEYVMFRKTEKIEIGSSGKTMLIPVGSEKVDSDRDKAICCYDYDKIYKAALFLPKKITIYEWDCKDHDQFVKDVLEFIGKYDAKTLSLVPLDHEQAVLIQSDDIFSTYSKNYSFYKDGKAYSVEFEVERATSNIIQPIVNSIEKNAA